MKVTYRDKQGEVQTNELNSLRAKHPDNEIDVVPARNVLEIDGNSTKADVNTASQSREKPRYSQEIDGKWFGLDNSLKPVTDGYRTHKELKKSLDVDLVKGYTKDSEKYYALIYPPSEG